MPDTERQDSAPLPSAPTLPTLVQLTAPGPLVVPGVSTRYTLHDEIARGGMGIVSHATDTTLGRAVAVKVLHERLVNDAGATHRFLDEARIMGQLQHPGIPAVHDLGTLPDGRPFLAMKLVKGRTLAEELVERRSVDFERGRFLAIFEAICQALGYVHSHGVIHRDLKPANVMVGAFGEVQVMDWGLAKVLASGGRQPPDSAPASDITAISSTRDSDGSETQAGAVLGTPAFMPPEQAIGAVDRIDARSDVFGLGAILVSILTDLPPFVAPTAEAARQLSARGKLDDAFARLDACGADPDLVALCKQCLAPEPCDRPADAGVVADAVAALRAAAEERARTAEARRIETLAEAREQRKRWLIQLGLLAALGLLVTASVAFLWWQAVRANRNALAVAALLEQCEAALGAGDADKAEVALEAAQKRAEEGSASDLRARIADCQADLAVLRELNRIDQIRWAPVENKWLIGADLARRYRTALTQYGIDPEAGNLDEAAARLDRSAVRARLLATLDLALASKDHQVRALLQRVDPHPFRDAVRDALKAGNEARVAQLASRAEAADQPPGFVVALNESYAVPFERVRELLKAAHRRAPADLSLLMALGNSYPFNEKDSSAARVRWFQAAVAAAPESPATHNGLGVALLDAGDRVGAVAAFQKAVELDPKFANSHNNLGWALRARGDLDAAIAALRESLRLDGTSGYPRINLARIYKERGDLEAARTEYREALKLDPEDATTRFSLAEVERWLALRPRLPDILAGKAEPKSPAEALDCAALSTQGTKQYAAAVRLAEQAFAAEPKLADDLKASHRYNAACYAAQAATAKNLTPAVRAALRAQALAWLRADLEASRKQAGSAEATDREAVWMRLRHWTQDPDLASIQPDAAHTGWSADEVTAWDTLWAEVYVVYARASRPAANSEEGGP